MAGSAILFCVPMACALLSFWGPPRSDGAPVPAVVAIHESAPAVEPLPVDPPRPLATISFEPLAEATRPEALEVPVVRPAGYLLPDDGAEESVHAGG